MNLDLTNRNALVCGGSKGIGQAAAIELAKLGANVTLISRSAEKMAEVISQLPHNYSGHDHDFLVADLTDHADLKRKLHRLVAEKKMHILVNNTGGPPPGRIIDSEPNDFLVAFNHHLMSYQLLLSILKPGMEAEGYGRIINVISTSVKQPIDGLGVSNTIRGAVANWAKTVASELASLQITVNNVLPGATETGRLKEIIAKKAQNANSTYEEAEAIFKSYIPMKRFAKPEEIGGVIAFLASPAAAYITGTNVVVDGGRTKSL